MFIPPQKFTLPKNEAAVNEALIRLQSSHLLIDREIASQVFKNDHNVYVVYYPKNNSLLIAPISDELFKKLHKANQHMLKDRNLKGDKSIALHELLIDNQLDDSDRSLEFKVESALGILNIKI
ncbi:MAG: hypothetical protein R2788_04305 [Saprospiraceae bacterium]